MQIADFPEVECLLDASINEVDDRQLRELLSTCFTGPDDFVFKDHRHFRIKPKHRFLLRDSEGIIRGNIAVHDLSLGTQDGDLRVAGIAEVAVHPDLRGRGLANLMLKRVHAWAAQEGFPFAMLYGKHEIYGSKGYIPCANIQRYLDWKTQTTLEGARGGMFKPLADKKWPEGLIDLRGPTF